MEIGVDREMLALIGAALEPGEPPSRVLIVPWGRVESSSGDFVVDEESARLVTQAFQEQGTDLPIDYEHQTLGGAYTSPSGQAPAAGWIKRLEIEEGLGIFAEVAWTPPAAEQLAARQYRYLSPVALIRKSDRKLVALHSAALTNKPAIAHMVPLVMRNAECGVRNAGADLELHVAIEVLRERLALPVGCGDVEVIAAAQAKLDDDAEAEERRTAEERVVQAQRQGRVTPPQRAWAVKLAMSDPTLFDEWLETAPVVAPLGRLSSPVQVNSDGAIRERRATVARAEFRSHPELAGITSEEAYVAASLRDEAVVVSGER